MSLSVGITLIGYLVLSMLVTFRVSKQNTPKAFIFGGLFLTLLGMLTVPVISLGLERSLHSERTQSVVVDFFLIYSYTLGGRALWEGLLKMGQNHMVTVIQESIAKDAFVDDSRDVITTTEVEPSEDFMFTPVQAVISKYPHPRLNDTGIVFETVVLPSAYD
jgi:hypothetical protein